MFSNSIVLAILLLASQFASPALGIRSRAVPDVSTEFPYFVNGSDAASDPATTGYFLNHVCLNVQNLTQMSNFYSSAFGLRHIFTLRASEHVSFTYMGYSHGGRNGTGYQTAEELQRQKNNIEGLLELIYVDVPSHNLPASTKITNTFGHIGIMVPDIEATQQRLEKIPSVNILKGFGDSLPVEGPVANALGLGADTWAQIDPDEQQLITRVFNQVTEQIIFATDPEGNLLEILPQS